MADLTRFRIPTPLPSASILAAIDEPPGLPLPGAVAALPASLVPDDRSDVGFLYGIITGIEPGSLLGTTAVQRSGDTMTGLLTINPSSGDKLRLQKAGTNRFVVDVNGSLDVNVDGDIGVIAQFRHSNVTDMFVSSSGNAHLRGNFGVGPDADTPAHRLTVFEPEIELWFNNVPDDKSGGRGLHINKIPSALPQDEVAHVIVWNVDGTPHWGCGVDFETQRLADGNSDFVSVYDYHAGIMDDGSLEDTGADIFRISPASHATVGQGPKFNMSYRAGSPRDFTEFFTCDAGLGLGGQRISVNHDVTKTALVMAQRSTTHNRCSTSLSNANDPAPLWEYGVDVLAAGRSSWAFTLTDHKTTSAKDVRLFIEGTNNLVARYGFGTIGPQATHHLLFSAEAGAFDTVQSHWCASAEDQGTAAARHNRAINIQSILDASTVKNFLLLSGGLGAGSTTATPVLTSTGAGAFGLMRTDTELSLIGAGAGTNQTIVQGLRMNTSGQLGFFGSAPSAKPTISGSRGGNAALADLLTKGATLGLWVDGTSA